MNENILIGSSGISLIFFSTLASATAQMSPPVLIGGEVEQRSVTTNRNVLVTVNLTNIGNLTANELDVQVISSGLNIISQKNWPENIYPNSSLFGQYTLQPSYDGTFPISVSTTYTLNDTRSHPPVITQMVSQQDLGVVYVQSDPFLSWSTVWAGAPTTILGTVVGFGITKLTDYITSKRTEERDRKQKEDLAKSLTLSFLEINQKKVETQQPPRLKHWESIEQVYEFVPEGLRGDLRNLYLDVDFYSRDRTNADLRKQVCESIDSLLKRVKGEWKT